MLLLFQVKQNTALHMLFNNLAMSDAEFPEVISTLYLGRRESPGACLGASRFMHSSFCACFVVGGLGNVAMLQDMLFDINSLPNRSSCITTRRLVLRRQIDCSPLRSRRIGDTSLDWIFFWMLKPCSPGFMV